MANLIKQKYLEGIDSSKFKIEQGGAIKAENASGTLVDVFKFDTAQNIVKIYNDKQVADTDFVNGLITQEISDRNAAISQAISDLINGAPAALDTLKEISDALAEDQTALDGLLQSLTEYVKIDGSRAFTNNLPMGSNKITGLANGQMLDEAVNKGQLDSGVQEAKDYTDNLENRSMLLDGSQAMQQNLPMGSYKITGLANAMMLDEAVNKGQLDSGVQEAKDYTDNLENRAMLLDGSQAMQQNLPMGSYKITGLANAMMLDEAVNKGQLDSGVQESKDYTDNLENRVMLLDGSQAMTQNLPMGSYKITGLANAMMLDEAVNKGQLDSVEQGLQSQITTEKDRVDAILSMADADKDSFVEIVTLINSIDTSNSDALAGHLVDAEDAHDASAISVVPAGNLAATQVQGALEELQVHIDTVEQSVTNLDAYAQEIRSDLETEIADRIADVNAEETRAIAAEGVLQGNIDAEAQARSDEDVTFFKLDGSRAITGTTTMQDVSANVVTVNGSINMGVNSIDPGIYWMFDDGEGHLFDGTILPGKLEFNDYVPNNEQHFLLGFNNSGLIQRSKTVYEVLDPETGAVISPQVTLNTSLSFEAIHASQAFTVYSEHSLKLRSNTISLKREDDEIFEPTLPEHAVTKAYVDSQISANKDFAKETFEIDVTAELSYVELAQTPVANSLVVFVNRLAVHEGVDYTVSVVDGVTRLTWAGDFAVGGVEEIELGDFIRVTYMY